MQLLNMKAITLTLKPKAKPQLVIRDTPAPVINTVQVEVPSKPQIKTQIKAPIKIPIRDKSRSNLRSNLRSNDDHLDLSASTSYDHDQFHIKTYLLPLYGKIVHMSIDNKRIYELDGESLIGTVRDNGIIAWEPV